MRYRPAAEDTATGDCPATDPSCWVLLGEGEVAEVEVQARPVEVIEVRTPLDLVQGEPFTAEVVLWDRFHNPVRTTTALDLVDAQGRPRGTATFTDTFRADVDLTAGLVDALSIRVDPSDPDAAGWSRVHHWSRVWEPGRPRWERRTGDPHIHTGVDGTLAFVREWSFGDHRGNVVRGSDALRFLDGAAGHDFGALSEHGMASEGHEVPSVGFDAFQAGGLCAPGLGPVAGTGDWWTLSQQVAHQYDVLHPDFVAFPAFEWHGAVYTPDTDAPVHRIVMYRDHDVPGFGHPLLGRAFGRPPQCLFHYLDLWGVDEDDVVVMPHMMRSDDRNLDFDLAYAPEPTWAALAGPERTAAYQRVGELLSARNYRGDVTGGAELLTKFEGQGQPGPSTFCYGWRDTAAVIGVIAGGDNHTGKPGSDDPLLPDGSQESRYDPGGLAVGLTTPASSVAPRDRIFDAFRARRTYGTSGPRSYLDFSLSHDGDTWPMGSEVDVGKACAVQVDLRAMGGEEVRQVAVIGARVGGSAPYTPVVDVTAPGHEVVVRTAALSNPVDPAAPEPETWLYYTRAFFGDPPDPQATGPELLAGHRDAAWSSPIWVTWHPADCP